jgi:hypothetical protein
MSGGGSPSRTTQVSEPWSGAQPYLRGLFSEGLREATETPQYYGGPLTVGPLQSEQDAFQRQAQYSRDVFGGQPTLRYGDATSALGSTLQGNTQLGQLSNSFAPGAQQALGQSFTGPSQLGGNYSLNPSGMGPQFGVAGDLDARGAYSRMLSGQPDYQGAQGAIDAANAPIVRQFEQQILPSLNQKATFLNNPTGGYKTLNQVLPEMGERMSMNAQNIMNQERLRSLDSQERAANAISQGGFQSYGLGLDAASRQAGLNLQADSTNADLSDRYRADALSYGSLAGQLAGQQGSQALGAAGMFPSLYGVGQDNANLGFGYAQYQRGLHEDALAADQDRFNYLRDQPWNRLQQYAGMLTPGAGIGGSMTTTGRGPGGSRTAGAIGGAAAGASIGSSISAGAAGGSAAGPWGTVIGALLGAGAGYFA